MLQEEKPEAFAIATNEYNSLADFVEVAFEVNGLDWQKHVDISPGLYQPTDIDQSLGDSSRAVAVLGWSANYHMRNVIREMSHPSQY